MENSAAGSDQEQRRRWRLEDTGTWAGIGAVVGVVAPALIVPRFAGGSDGFAWWWFLAIAVTVALLWSAVSLGHDHIQRALDIGRHWTPPPELPEERRSGFFIELARAQLWAGRADDAFASLQTARRIAPQHTRDHQWVRQDAATLRRLKRADAHSLTSFTEWCHAT